jgi:hypothetical protein
MPGFANDSSFNSIVFADNVDFSGNHPQSRQITTDGQLLIGSTTAPNIRTGNIVSSDGSVLATYSSPNLNLVVSGKVSYNDLDKADFRRTALGIVQTTYTKSFLFGGM